MTQSGGVVVGFVATAVVKCNCGSELPVMVPFVTGGTLKAVCQCGVKFSVAKIEFSIEDAGNSDQSQLKLALAVEAPLIMPASDVRPFKRPS